MIPVVFVGPTLPVDDARKELDADYLPPAVRGDIYRATCRKPAPKIIVLIDGEFSQQASVNHKEILWAMAQGIHVFGAASMGALRAAELSVFGMVGVGHIFESLVRGELEDDDEVAIGHGPAHAGYPVLSDAMVDLRATFAFAVANKVISPVTENLLLKASKQIFYMERSFPASIAGALELGTNKDELLDFEQWYPANKISQKKHDALQLLAQVRQFLVSDPTKKVVDYKFEHTEFWQQGLANADAVE